jgi:TonB family protein
MSHYASNYRASKSPKKKKKVTHPVQTATGSFPQSSSDGQVSTPHVSAPSISELEEHATPSQIQVTRKQAGKRGGAFFVSLVLHLVAAFIATAYVVQEKIANEELMQGVLMKPAPKPTLKRRSRPRTAKTTTPRKTIDTPKPQLQQIATTSARLPMGSERFTIPASNLSVGSIGEPSTQLGRGLFAGARQAQVVAVTPQFEAPKFMNTSISSKIDTGNSFAQMDFNPEAMEPIMAELRDATQSFTEFLQSIREKIKRSQRYPRSVRNLADDSEAQVQFTIRRDGSLVDAKVVASSGSKSLDAAALAAVRDAAPYPSFPEGQEGSTLRLEIPISFQLKTN